MDGQRAFDQIGIKAIRKKAYLPLNEFVVAIEVIKSTSDEYTLTELDSYNYVFAPLLNAKQYLWQSYAAEFPGGTSNTTMSVQYFTVEGSFTVEYSAAFHIYDYADVPYTQPPIGRDAGINLTRAKLIAQKREE